MGGITTFGNNDSVFSHGEDSISMLNRLAEIAKEAYKYIPEKDCTVECGTFVDVDTSAFLSAIQHFRESIEAYRDITEELDDDLREVRKAYADDMERIRKYGTRSVDAEKLFEQLNEDREHFRQLAISRNKELEREREKSNQLEQQLSVKTRLFELAKKFLHQRRNQLSVLEEELRQNLLVKDAQKKVIDEKEKQISDLHHEIWELREQVEYWEDIAKKYADPNGCNPNNPQNFCGNCKHFVIHSNDIATCNNKWASPYIVDPDDAACPHFESNQVDRDKPDHEVCDNCDKECGTCGYYPF